MKKYASTILILPCAILALSLMACPTGNKPGPTPSPGPAPTPLPYVAGSNVADASVVRALMDGRIPEAAISAAKTVLHIGYGHTSHGSQLSSGLYGLVAFANDGNLGGTAYATDLFAVSSDGAGDSLHLFEGSGYTDPGLLMGDIGWGVANLDSETREYLNAYPACNVIMWSWCGQVSGQTEQSLIDNYLTPMAQLEEDYPAVTFIYMTGHLASNPAEAANTNARNQQIRDYCQANENWLYDFANIESYDPDGAEYLSRLATDGCNYDASGDNVVSTVPDSGDPPLPAGGDANWATDWQDAHAAGVDWYSCSPAHSVDINGNMKAYAAWWLFARIGGWDGTLSE